ncbi:MAG: flagellar type III secretion system pore protein FliP [Gemmatimonadales bacterium]
MNVASFLGVLGVLGFVLALLVITLKLLKRYAPFATGANQRVKLEVVQRIPLGPRQAVAVVRIGDAYIAVSVGDGGVRRLADVPAPVPDERKVYTPATVASAPRTEFREILRRSFKAGACLIVLAGGAHTLRAQQAAPAKTAAAPATKPAAKQADSTAKKPDSARVKSPVVARVRTATAPIVGAPSADTMLMKLAPRLDLRVGNENAGGLRLSGTVGIVIMMGLLTLLPTLVLMMTGFTRIFIVLGFLRQALGTQSAPPTQLVAGLALLLTGFVMAPTLEQVNTTAIQPWMDGKIEQSVMLSEGVKPFRAFMLRQTRESDLVTFMELSRQPRVAHVEDVPLVVLTSAFVTSELRTSFQIGFALFLPFIVIDVVVASVLMSMGMMMLPPAMISLPFKLLLFVLVDGWTLVVNGLIQSFH